MPFGQSCMCLDPMLIVFSFLRNQWLFFIHTWLWKILVILQNKSGLKKMFYLWSTLSATSPSHACDSDGSFIPSCFSFFFFFFLWLLCGICLRLCLFFRVGKSCVTYLIGQREKCHNRVEIGLWWDWTRGLDETPCHQGNRKLMKSHHMERWCLSLHRTRLQPSRPSCSSPRTALDKDISRKENQSCVQTYTTENLKASHYFSDETKIEHTTLPLLTHQKALITVRGATKSCASYPNLQYTRSLLTKYVRLTWH